MDSIYGRPINASIECFMGWMTLALGVSIWQPNQSIPYTILSEWGNAQAWSAWLTLVGIGMMASSKIRNTPWKVLLASVTFCTWAFIVWLIRQGGSMSPTAWNGVLICAYALILITRYSVGEDPSS